MNKKEMQTAIAAAKKLKKPEDEPGHKESMPRGVRRIKGKFEARCFNAWEERVILGYYQTKTEAADAYRRAVNDREAMQRWIKTLTDDQQALVMMRRHWGKPSYK